MPQGHGQQAGCSNQISHDHCGCSGRRSWRTRSRLCSSSPAILDCERARGHSRPSRQERTPTCFRALQSPFPSLSWSDRLGLLLDFQASSFTAPSACPTHVSTNPWALESGSSPSSASIRTFPSISFVLQVPHCPCRHDEDMPTPCSSAASNNVWPLRMLQVLPDRTNSTTTLVSGAIE